MLLHVTVTVTMTVAVTVAMTVTVTVTVQTRGTLIVFVQLDMCTLVCMHA